MIYFFWDLMAQSLSALPALFVLGLSWLSIQLSDLISARARAEKVRAMLGRFDDAVFTAVREVEQALVIPLKKASPSGTLRTAERGAASARAAETARACFGAQGWHALGTTLGLSSEELEHALDARVEAAVYELHAQLVRGLSDGLRAALSNGETSVVGVGSYSRSKMEGNLRVQ
jgi:hypothetical protein